jgi:hypothetical protein
VTGADDIKLKRNWFGIALSEFGGDSNMPEIVVLSVTAVICADLAYRAWLLSR